MPSGFTISICCYLMFVTLLSLLLKLLIFVCAGVRKMMVQNQKLTQKEIKGLYLPSRLASQAKISCFCFFIKLMLSALLQLSLKADERDVYEFFSRAGKVMQIIYTTLHSNLKTFPSHRSMMPWISIAVF